LRRQVTAVRQASRLTIPSPGLAFIDGSSEEGDESLYGGCVVGNHLSWAEPTWTGLIIGKHSVIP